MKQLLISLLISVCLPTITNAQTAPSKPCSAPECGQFDFCVGEWELTYNDTVHAANSITKDMGGCVVHEHFGDPANKYHGESWSVYSPKWKIWQQTWVDDQGAYIALKGNFKDGKMLLLTDPATLPDGSTIQNRMVYYNITATTFDWDWESTTDQGKIWKNNWHIHYKRK